MTADKHRVPTHSAPSSFPEMRRPTFAAGDPINPIKNTNSNNNNTNSSLFNQSLSSDSAYGNDGNTYGNDGNDRNDTVHDALNQFLHEYKLPVKGARARGGDGRGDRGDRGFDRGDNRGNMRGDRGDSRGVSLSPPRVRISTMGQTGRERQSYSVSPDRHTDRYTDRSRSRSNIRPHQGLHGRDRDGRDVWNYSIMSPTRGRVTRRMSRREQRDRDAGRSAHGNDSRRAALAGE